MPIIFFKCIHMRAGLCTRVILNLRIWWKAFLLIIISYHFFVHVFCSFAGDQNQTWLTKRQYLDFKKNSSIWCILSVRHKGDADITILRLIPVKWLFALSAKNFKYTCRLQFRYVLYFMTRSMALARVALKYCLNEEQTYD